MIQTFSLSLLMFFGGLYDSDQAYELYYKSNKVNSKDSLLIKHIISTIEIYIRKKNYSKYNNYY